MLIQLVVKKNFIYILYNNITISIIYTVMYTTYYLS